MGKAKKTDREFGREKRLAHENTKLKRENAQLRKMLARVDLDRYAGLKDTIERHYAEDEAHHQTGQDMLEKLKAEWKCRECVDGFLEIFLFNKGPSLWYLRKCNCCFNRTKSQRYDPDTVKGIVKKT